MSPAMHSICPQYPIPSAKIIESSEVFEEVDGKYQFTKVLIVCQAGNQLYHGTLIGRPSLLSKINIKDHQDVIPIPKTAYQPRFKSFITKAPVPLPDDCYVKRPSLICYDRVRSSGNPYRIAQHLLQEINVYEVLRQHPHPNVATYLGCEVQEESYITGICLIRYPETLMKRVNPRGHMKRAFKYDPKTLKDREKVLHGIKSGISHLHSLGLVFNDLNPSNIMLLDDDTPIIVDFDSCRRIGQDLKGVGRTYEWFDEQVSISCLQNDLDALKEITEWLSEKDMKNFQFVE
jgi:serine/threonine protein kinase